jgi:hypothetical protein
MVSPELSADDFADLLRMALADPAPADLFTVSEAVFEIGHLESELAELVSVESASAGVRGDADNERHTYVVGDYTVVLEIDFTERTITGQFLPPVGGQVTLENSGSETVDTVTVAPTGTFALHTEQGAHRVRAEIRPEGKPPTGFHTHWITLS